MKGYKAMGKRELTTIEKIISSIKTHSSERRRGKIRRDR